MRDTDVDSAWLEWVKEFAEWTAGGHQQAVLEYGAGVGSLDQPYRSFCLWYDAPPNPECHRPKWKDGEATWFQVYETVSEGTPVTPPFATKAELVEYLVANGDFWDQKRREEGGSGMPCEPWNREAAEQFVNDAWAPSMIQEADGSIHTPGH